MNYKVLLVEDNHECRDLLALTLGHLGYQVLQADDGDTAVKKALSEKPDLILMDIQLPIMDGYEATRRIKANPELRHIPIIVVTSYALSGDEEKARASGCDAYFTKPYSPRQLLAKIKELLP